MIVFQAADCDRTLDFAGLFDRPTIARRMAVSGALAGSHRDYLAVQRRLAHQRRVLSVAVADERFLRGLRSLGHRSTPFLIVFDRAGVVRYSTPEPHTPEEYLELADVLARISRT